MEGNASRPRRRYTCCVHIGGAAHASTWRNVSLGRGMRRVPHRSTRPIPPAYLSERWFGEPSSTARISSCESSAVTGGGSYYVIKTGVCTVCRTAWLVEPIIIEGTRPVLGCP